MSSREKDNKSKKVKKGGGRGQKNKNSKGWPTFDPGSSDAPAFVKEAIECLEKRGLREEGLFRISALQTEVEKLAKVWKKGKMVPLDQLDVHVVAATLKLWFREFDDPLLTFELYDAFVEAASQQQEEQKRGYIRQAVALLPPGNRAVLRLLLSLLHKMQHLAQHNKMTAANLAIVFAPSVIRAENESQQSALLNMRVTTDLVEYLIVNNEKIFAEGFSHSALMADVSLPPLPPLSTDTSSSTSSSSLTQSAPVSPRGPPQMAPPSLPPPLHNPSPPPPQPPPPSLPSVQPPAPMGLPPLPPPEERFRRALRSGTVRLGTRLMMQAINKKQDDEEEEEEEQQQQQQQQQQEQASAQDADVPPPVPDLPPELVHEMSQSELVTPTTTTTPPPPAPELPELPNLPPPPLPPAPVEPEQDVEAPVKGFRPPVGAVKMPPAGGQPLKKMGAPKKAPPPVAPVVAAEATKEEPVAAAVVAPPATQSTAQPAVAPPPASKAVVVKGLVNSGNVVPIKMKMVGLGAGPKGVVKKDLDGSGTNVVPPPVKVMPKKASVEVAHAPPAHPPPVAPIKQAPATDASDERVKTIKKGSMIGAPGGGGGAPGVPVAAPNPSSSSGTIRHSTTNANARASVESKLEQMFVGGHPPVSKVGAPRPLAKGPPPGAPVGPRKTVQELLSMMAEGKIHQVTEYLNGLDKKDRDETKAQLSELLNKI